MKRTYTLTRPVCVTTLSPPVGGGLYVVTAGKAGSVIYVGKTASFAGRRFRYHHRRADWFSACGKADRPFIRFAVLHPDLSPSQLRDVEARLISRVRPRCNRQHVHPR